MQQETKLIMSQPSSGGSDMFLRKRDRILRALKTRCFQTEQKFGTELPKTVERALEIEQGNWDRLLEKGH